MVNGQKNNKIIIWIGGFLIILLGVGVGLLFKENREEKIQYFFELLGEKDIIIYQGSEYLEPGYRAYDNKGNDYNQEVVVTGYVNSEIVGEYVVTYKYNEYVEERKVTVLAKSTQLTFVILFGEKIIYLKSGEEYVEPGYDVIDSYNDNLKNKVIIEGKVDTNNPGTYKLRYSVVNALGVEVVAERIIIVESIYHLELNGSSEVDHLIGNKYVDRGCTVYDEQGNKVDVDVKVSGSVNVNKEGVYKIKYSMNYRGYNETVERTVNVLGVSCNGTVNRYGTVLNVSGSGVKGQSSFTWNVDGEKYNSSSKLSLSYQKVNKASVEVLLDDMTGQVGCKIVNKLLYDFEYDSENTKPFIGCNTYTTSDKERLESILKNVINEAGYGTRAGVVEAARFLVGGLEYKIPYLGPKTHDYQLGRYSQVGLNIASNSGWGCMVSGWTQGIDCTNFVNWAFVQAGLKVSGVYSTLNVYSIKDVVNRLQVGDLLLTPGEERAFTHVGIIIGIDSNSIYVAEATTGKINAVVTTRIDKNNLPTRGKFSKAKLYVYQQNGDVTNMWVS